MSNKAQLLSNDKIHKTELTSY